jgi:phosphoribosylglycinamide formyltransferase 2
MILPVKILLLGSGELGKEFVIALQRLGCHVVACDSYDGAPAMQVADEREVFPMLDAAKLSAAIDKHKPDMIVPEVEAIRTETLQDYETKGFHVVPSARAVYMTMNRDRIREVAAQELGLRTSHYRYAETLQAMQQAVREIGLPVVIKPVMSSSGKGQKTVRTASEIDEAWHYAVANMRGDRAKVIVEEFIDFDYEITLLTVRGRDRSCHFCEPIGHRQERGDYMESWQPQPMEPKLLKDAQDMARAVTDNLGGAGIFGVEFFITKTETIFSELSPRPHDTGMVTMISQNLTQFDLHCRAILGLPIPRIEQFGPSASAVILADRNADRFDYALDTAVLNTPLTDLRIFGKPTSRLHRRMGVGLARTTDTAAARKLAKRVADSVTIKYR